MPGLHGIQGITPPLATPRRKYRRKPYPWEIKRQHQTPKDEFREKLEALLNAAHEREKLSEPGK